jgi:hypothetical protein
MYLVQDIAHRQKTENQLLPAPETRNTKTGAGHIKEKLEVRIFSYVDAIHAQPHR